MKSSPIAVVSPLGSVPDLGLLDDLPPKALLTPQQIADAGLISLRHQETLRGNGRLRYHKLSGRVRYYAIEFRRDLYRCMGGEPELHTDGGRAAA
jgi:hypothetical protein